MGFKLPMPPLLLPLLFGVVGGGEREGEGEGAEEASISLRECGEVNKLRQREAIVTGHSFPGLGKSEACVYISSYQRHTGGERERERLKAPSCFSFSFGLFMATRDWRREFLAM